MRIAVVGVVAAVAWAGLGRPALAQPGGATGPFTSAGIPVGSGADLETIGRRDPQIGRPVGNQIGEGVGGVSRTSSQDFSKIDPSQLAAPLPNYRGIGGAPTLWDRVRQPFVSMGHFFSPSAPTMEVARPHWVPGISRRNRARGEERRRYQD